MLLFVTIPDLLRPNEYRISTEKPDEVVLNDNSTLWGTDVSTPLRVGRDVRVDDDDRLLHGTIFVYDHEDERHKCKARQLTADLVEFGRPVIA